MKHKILGLFLAFLVLCTNALQAQTEASDNGLMRSNGKIFVVMAVTLIILLGLVFFLVQLERRISRLEKGGE